jgi:hypothetical protein
VKKCLEEMEQDQEVKVRELVEVLEEEIFLQDNLSREQALGANVYALPVERFNYMNPECPVLR